MEPPVQPVFTPAQNNDDPFSDGQNPGNQDSKIGLVSDTAAFDRSPSPSGPLPELSSETSTKAAFSSAFASTSASAPTEAPVPVAEMALTSTLESGLIPTPDSGRIPYDIKNEPMPAHQLYNDPFQGLIRRGKDLAETVMSTLSSYKVSSTASSDLQKLLQTSRKCIDFSATDT